MQLQPLQSHSQSLAAFPSRPHARARPPACLHSIPPFTRNPTRTASSGDGHTYPVPMFTTFILRRLRVRHHRYGTSSSPVSPLRRTLKFERCVVPDTFHVPVFQAPSSKFQLLAPARADEPRHTIRAPKAPSFPASLRRQLAIELLDNVAQATGCTSSPPSPQSSFLPSCGLSNSGAPQGPPSAASRFLEAGSGPPTVTRNVLLGSGTVCPGALRRGSQYIRRYRQVYYLLHVKGEIKWDREARARARVWFP